MRPHKFKPGERVRIRAPKYAHCGAKIYNREIVTIKEALPFGQVYTLHECNGIWPGLYLEPTFETFFFPEKEKLYWRAVIKYEPATEAISCTVDQYTVLNPAGLVLKEGTKIVYWAFFDTSSDAMAFIHEIVDNL